MSFQPVLPFTGYTGWRFLDRTLESQQAAFAQSQPVMRATDYFRENIAKVFTAEDLVSDRRLLSVALGAFGLDEDINNKAFIRRILEDGTTSDDALSNRLADKRYQEFSRAFGFGDSPVPRTVLSSFSDRIIAKYENRQFERAVGEKDNDLRLALNVKQGLTDILNATESVNAQWFSIIGNVPLRNVFQTAMGLPTGLASIDLDQQLGVFKARAKSLFGSDGLAEISKPDQQEKLIRLFLLRAEAANISAASGASTALTLLQSSPQLNAR